MLFRHTGELCDAWVKIGLAPNPSDRPPNARSSWALGKTKRLAMASNLADDPWEKKKSETGHVKEMRSSDPHLSFPILRRN